jgi:hypothetical protein
MPASNDEKNGAYGKEDRDQDSERDEWSEVRNSAQKAIRRANARGSRRGRLAGLIDRRGVLLAACVAGLIVLVLVVYALVGPSRTTQTPSATSASATRTLKLSPGGTATNQPATQPNAGSQSATPSPPPATGGSSASTATESQDDVESESLVSRIATIALRLALAALIATLLAFRPRKDLPVSERNPRVMQAQILLAVAASCLVLIVAGDVTRGLVALAVAVLLIPFRTAELDPKEAMVLLICGAVGIATGAGRWAIAIILGLFAFLMLWALEHYGSEQMGGAALRQQPVVSGRKDEMVS